MISLESRNIRAPELFGDFWFNSGPMSIRALKGSIILIDFWDYSCINCLRTLPYVKEWHRRYQSYGFLVIGIHTPEFKFGKNPENVEHAIKDIEIEFPVVTDNDAIIWTAFTNRYWPTKYLIDKDGFIRYSLQGEGGYEQFERAIQSLLIEAGFRGVLPELMRPLRDVDASGAICFRSTGEIQLGYLRGTIGNIEGFSPEGTLDYDDQGLYLSGRFYLKGKWFNEKEFVRFDGDTAEEGSIALRYEALEVNVVMNAERHRQSKVFVYQDGLPLTKENSGVDVGFDEQGGSYVLVDTPRMFNLVKNREFSEHDLKLLTSSPTLTLYSFSFVTGVIPNLISNN